MKKNLKKYLSGKKFISGIFAKVFTSIIFLLWHFKFTCSKKFIKERDEKPSRGGLVVESLLPNSCWKCTLLRWVLIPSKYGVSIVSVSQKTYVDNRPRSAPALELLSRAASSVGVTVSFQWSKHREQSRRSADRKKKRWKSIGHSIDTDVK